MRDELHAEDLLHRGLGVRLRLRDLHAAAFAAATCVDLRLDDHDLGARLLLHLGDRGDRFFGGHRGNADWHRHAVLLKELFALVLVDLHAAGLSLFLACSATARRVMSGPYGSWTYRHLRVVRGLRG